MQTHFFHQTLNIEQITTFKFCNIFDGRHHFHPCVFEMNQNLIPTIFFFHLHPFNDNIEIMHALNIFFFRTANK